MVRENCRLEQFYYPLQLNVMEMLSWGKMDGDVIDAASQTAAVKTYEVQFVSCFAFFHCLSSIWFYLCRDFWHGSCVLSFVNANAVGFKLIANPASPRLALKAAALSSSLPAYLLRLLAIAPSQR